MKKLIMLAFIALISVLVLSSCAQVNEPTGLYISTLSYPTGNPPNHILNQDEQYIPYTFSLVNNSEQVVFVSSIVPVLSEVLSSRLTDKDLKVAVEKTVEPKGYIEVLGGVYFDAKGLSKNDIGDSLITGVKVTSEKTIILPSR